MITINYNYGICTIDYSSFKLPQLYFSGLDNLPCLYYTLHPLYNTEGIVNNFFLYNMLNTCSLSYIKYNLYLYVPYNSLHNAGTFVNSLFRLYSEYHYILHNSLVILSIVFMIYFLFCYLLPLLSALLGTCFNYLYILINLFTNNSTSNLVASSIDFTDSTSQIIISIFGSLFYISLHTSVDLWFASSSISFIRLTATLSSLAGAFFSTMILVGILSTNYVYYWYTDNHITSHNNTSGGILIVVGNILSVLFSAIWFFLGSVTSTYNWDVFSSIFSAITEYFSFLGVVLSTYDEWNYWLTLPLNMNYIQLIGFLLGMFVFSISTRVLVHIELCSHRNFLHYLAYGIDYTIWWTAAVFSTNPVLYMLQSHQISLPWSIVLALICAIVTGILTPDLYPAHFSWYGSPVSYHVYMVYYPDRSPGIIPWELALISGISMYFLILSYVITGYIVQNFLSGI